MCGISVTPIYLKDKENVRLRKICNILLRYTIKSIIHALGSSACFSLFSFFFLFFLLKVFLNFLIQGQETKQEKKVSIHLITLLFVLLSLLDNIHILHTSCSRDTWLREDKIRITFKHTSTKIALLQQVASTYFDNDSWIVVLVNFK